MKLTLLALLIASSSWAGSSTTHEWFPRRPEFGGENNGAIINSPQCVEVLSPFSITGTSLTWFQHAAMPAGKHCSAGIYSKDGTTLIVTSGPQLCDGTDVVHNVTGLAGFGLAAGTAYQVCYCGEVSSSGTVLGANDINVQNQALDNSLSVPIRTIGGNGCTAGGDLPTTIGTFTNDTGATRLLLLVGTNTP